MQQEIDFKYASLTEDLGGCGGGITRDEIFDNQRRRDKGHRFCPLQLLTRRRKTLHVFHCYRKYGHVIHPYNFSRKLYAKMGSTLPVLTSLIFFIITEFSW